MGRPVDVVTEIVIDRPVTEVASYAEDPATAPDWYRNISSASWRTTPPLAVGSEFDFEARFAGRTLRYTYRVVDYVPGERLVMGMTEGPFPMETTYEWWSAGEGRTRMRLRNRGEVSGFSALVTPFMSWMMRRANEADLRSIKARLESPTSRS